MKKEINEMLAAAQQADLEYYRAVYAYTPEFYPVTYDIGVATAFLVTGFRLVSIDSGYCSGKTFFIFESDGDEDRQYRDEIMSFELVHQYQADKLDIKAKSFFEHLKALEKACLVKKYD